MNVFKMINPFEKLKKSILFMIVLMSCHLVHAFSGGGMQGVKVSVSALKYDTKSEGSTLGTSDNKKLYLDYKLGYQSSNLYVGGVLSTYNIDSSGSVTKRTLTGATVGYHNNNFFIDGTYYFSGEVELSSLTKVKSGSGYAVEVGFETMLNSNLFLGVLGAYKSISYTKVSASGTETDVDNKESPEIYPMLLVGILF